MVREFSVVFPRGLDGAVPLRSATSPSCVPLDGSELDAKVETLSVERTLRVCQHAD